MSSRWNAEEIEGGIRICRGDHQWSDECDWVEYVPKTEADRLTRERDEAVAECARLREVLENSARWRDVADELPQEAQEVLFVRYGKTVHGAWIGGCFWHNNQQMAAAKWMPLPKPQTHATLSGGELQAKRQRARLPADFAERARLMREHGEPWPDSAFGLVCDILDAIGKDQQP